MDDIKKSNTTNHHYSDREKQQALLDYKERVVEEVHHIYDLYDQYLDQIEHKNFKSEKYDFELHNQLSFDIEQCKRRIVYAVSVIKDNYDINVEIPDFNIILENYQYKKDS